MTTNEQPGNFEYQEYVVQEPDKVSKGLVIGVVFLVICIFTVVVYALIVGVMSPPAPRTLAESSLMRARAAVKKNPGNGAAWAALASAQYAVGDTDAAWKSIALAKKRVKDRTILPVHSRELDFLVIEGKDAQVLKLADQYIQDEADAQLAEKAENLKKGISVPDAVNGNDESIRLFVLKATAEGNLGKWEDAIKTLNTALELDDRAADLITLRGWAELRSGDSKAAKQDFEKALKYIPDYASAKAGLAQAKKAAAEGESK